MRLDYDLNEVTKPERQEFEDFIFSDIGMCGCASPDDVLDMLEAFLERKQDYMSYDDQVAFAKEHSEELMLFMQYILDNKGFTEHGTSVYGAWLTDKGKRFLELLKI